MFEKGIVNFYYTKTLPSDAIAIAKISGTDFSPSDLVTINNTNLLDKGPLSVWKITSLLTGPADFTAPDINQSIIISGSTSYYLGNQFFELTNVYSTDNTPLYYYHQLPAGISNVNILDSVGNIVVIESLLTNNTLYHSQPDGFYQVRYVDSNGFVQTDMLLFTPVLSQSAYTTSNNLYTYGSKILSVLSTGNYYIRFTKVNGYQILTPYNTPSNVPWFVRIRFGINPTPPEWAKQSFIPERPYLLGTWVTGSVINTNTVQFERTNIYNNLNHLPDILVFDSDNNIKYALDGVSIDQISTKGYLYNWKKGLIKSVDNYKARVLVSVDLDPTDLIFGFYAYNEQDVVFTDLDVNPFTNPSIRNAQVTFYKKTNGQDLTKYLYYNIVDSNGNQIQTNDISPTTGTNNIFAQLVVGASISSTELTVTDIRQRGGGLTEASKNIPQANNFWDLGFWNGKSYPIAGCSIIYIPQNILTKMSKQTVQTTIEAILPLGTLAVIKYYDNQGNEY